MIGAVILIAAAMIFLPDFRKFMEQYRYIVRPGLALSLVLLTMLLRLPSPWQSLQRARLDAVGIWVKPPLRPEQLVPWTEVHQLEVPPTMGKQQLKLTTMWGNTVGFTLPANLTIQERTVFIQTIIERAVLHPANPQAGKPGQMIYKRFGVE